MPRFLLLPLFGACATLPGPVGRVLRRLEAPPPGASVEYRPPRRLIACVPPR